MTPDAPEGFIRSPILSVGMITSLLQPEQASPDLLVERKEIVGEGTLPDQLAKPTSIFSSGRGTGSLG